MALDSFGGSSTLEQRARRNNTDIDLQWIKENEVKEYPFDDSLTQGRTPKEIEELALSSKYMAEEAQKKLDTNAGYIRSKYGDQAFEEAQDKISELTAKGDALMAELAQLLGEDEPTRSR